MRRVAAWLANFLLGVALCAASFGLASYLAGPCRGYVCPGFDPPTLVIALNGTLLPFFILQGCLVAWRGCTIGMWLAGLKVVGSDGSAAGFRNGVMLRYLPLILLIGLPLVGWLAVTLNYKISGNRPMDDAMAWITATSTPLVLLYILVDSLSSLMRDGRTLHDRFAGTVVTPRQDGGFAN